jgi:ankyrin repeat protein
LIYVVQTTGKSTLFLAVENGYYDILVLLLHSKYNDITKTYLDTTPLEIAVWRKKMKFVQLLVQEENKLQKYLGNYHLFNILVDLKRSELCINEQTGKEDCQTQDCNHRHLPYPLWSILTQSDKNCWTHLLKIGLDINKRDYNGNTLLYKILNRPGLRTDCTFSPLISFEVVNVGKTKWISLLETKREQMLQIEKYKCLVYLNSSTWFELRKHIRRNLI